jgi:hypothetical protein
VADSIPPRPSRATFIDGFDRPDTEAGLGEGWDMRRPDKRTFPPPPASDGFLEDGRYTYAGASAVYAVRQFRGTVRGMGAIGRFRSIRFGAETALAMAITPNDKLTDDMLLFTAKRSGWDLVVRRAGGAYEPVAEGQFEPKLDLNRDYQFGFEATGDTVTVTVPGSEVTEAVATAGLLGNRGFWQEYPTRRPAGDVFDFDTVWALEDGLPVFMVGS